ncbi:hypothetical protein BAUCODRAFT_31036 [Baudoinia panamericana UAMH 10762]|uniref:Major facilitator superfamily (MFS) profile domain-containing protein n=1 Tax=Baudoinia panamericana (strain UAMH 10762) TaxID=717646 RepID=M2NHE1_BAUPA|nr:uncharacterized protein BAUCODRAFT_31036 [Baudoinia panamericana UAMH 10762]EMC98764.1 hypothetical protein BAUCODRAFT_31036 [Baudoinia panamericana UAMH 10762]
MDPNEAVIEADVELDQAARLRRHLNDGEQAAQASKGGVQSRGRKANDEQESDEEQPLLQEDGRKQSWAGTEDFSHLPWYKRPSILWVLFPFLLMTLAFGGSITPKVNLILQLVCREYISDRQLADPNFTMVPVDFAGGANDQCRIPEIQSRVAIFSLWGSLIAGLLSAVTSPKLGALSDRYGRKPILVITSLGTICGEVLTIFAALYPETFPVNLLLLGFAMDGLTGSFIVAMAIANSYASDCTPPQRRNVAFGYFHGCLFTGMAAGPIIAGYLVKYTGKIVIVFYILLAVHLFFVCFIALAVPESLSKKRKEAAQEKYSTELAELGPTADWISWVRHLNLLAPLSILWPKGPHATPALRWNLLVLAAVDTIAFGVAMGSITVVLIYTNYEFGWKTFEQSRFLSIVNACRVFCLIVVLPLLTRWIRGKPDMRRRNSGSDVFDLMVIRVAILFDTIGYLGYALSREGGPFILSGVVAAIGGIAAPTLQSSLTKHVPAEQTGQLLGASGLLHALARVVAPTIFNAIYSATVGKFSQTVYVCLAATFGLAFVISWFLRPHVYMDPGDMHTAGNEPGRAGTSSETDDGKSRIPIVSSVMAVFDAAKAHVVRRS